MQQGQLVTKKQCTCFGQCLNQVFEHGPQTPRNVNALAAKVTDLGEGQVNEILPVWRPVDESKPAGGVSYVSITQVPITDLAKEVMDLVQGKNRRGRVVNCRRKSLRGNVHHDAERKSRILLEGAFLANGNRLT